MTSTVSKLPAAKPPTKAASGTDVTTPNVVAPDEKPEWAQTRGDKKRIARAAAGKRPRRWPWVIVALLALGGIGYLVISGSQPKPVVTAEPVEVVMQLTPNEVVTIAPQELRQTVKVTGSLSPNQQAQLTAQVGGKVAAVNVRPGDPVTAGQTIAQIDVESLTLQLNQQRNTADATRAQLAQAQGQLERTTELVNKGLSPTSALEQATSTEGALAANVRALEGQIQAAEIALQNATVTAPFDGVVASRAIEPGQSINVGAPLFTVVNLDRIEAQAMTPISASTMIAAGQEVSIGVEGIPDRAFPGTVERINPVALEGTRTIPVYIGLDNVDGLLRGGMFVTGEITVAQRENAFAIPPASLRTDDSGTYVLKVVDGHVEKQVVTAGQTWTTANGRMIEISSGLASGDVVVVAALAQLLPGAKIQLMGE